MRRTPPPSLPSSSSSSSSFSSSYSLPVEGTVHQHRPWKLCKDAGASRPRVAHNETKANVKQAQGRRPKAARGVEQTQIKSLRHLSWVRQVSPLWPCCRDPSTKRLKCGAPISSVTSLLISLRHSAQMCGKTLTLLLFIFPELSSCLSGRHRSVS